MELDEEEPRSVWCLIATTAVEDGAAAAGGGSGATSAGGRDPARQHGARAFAPGTRVYCFPPTRAGAYESVKVVGPHRKTGKLVAEVVAARDLAHWKAERVADAAVLEQIAPPWDAGGVSRDVAQGIAAFKNGGPWPVAELRQWNRQNAEKQTGDGSLLSKVRGTFKRLLGRDD